MLSGAEATIYLASQRGRTEENRHRSYHTFNFGSYFNENRKPFADLYAINDDTLAGQATVTHQVKSDCLIVLLPIAGALRFQHSLEHGQVEVGQSYSFFSPQGSSFKTSNDYENELINFLHIWITIESAPGKAVLKSEVDLDLNKNQLMPLIAENHSSHKDLRVLLGKFDGRKEGIVSLQNPRKGAFAFVIEGAFEVGNRLLEPRDGLALWNATQTEFEALSTDAIILIIES